MRASYADDPQLRGRVFALLEQIFPGITRAAAHAAALGARWEDVSTPFVHEEDGELVSHVGLIELPLVIAGARRSCGTVHAVATRPDRRRAGHYRRVLEELLAHAEGRHELLLLTTEHPEYFVPFGFEIVPEWAFDVPEALVQAAGARPGAGGFVPFDVQDAPACAWLQQLLTERTPVSQRLGVVAERAIFCFNEGRRPLLVDRELACVLCVELVRDTLHVYDVVARELPPLEEILRRLPVRPARCVLHVGADRLAPAARARQELFEHDGPSWLLRRGAWPLQDEPCVLPRSART